MKKTYITPSVLVVGLRTNRALLETVSGTGIKSGSASTEYDVLGREDRGSSLWDDDDYDE